MTPLLFGGVLEKGYSLDARTDFDAKYVPRKEVPFGVAKPISKVWTPIFPKNAIFGPNFDGT